ncbi:MAG: hypothetical protein HOO67_07970 [Candidatus Peribacteraceae bacterium]|nr:hypothetical protein [Candidatus Peribacteraceae bacterium]
MSDSFLDNLPSTERRKLKKMMSPEAYERLREKVKGPEDLAKELKRGEQLAELSFELQTDEKLRERLKGQADKDFREYGVERVVDAQSISPESKKALEQGKFLLAVSSHPLTHDDQLVAVPEGNVHEKIPLKMSFSDRYVAQFLQSASPTVKLQDLSKRTDRKR